jgi:uncharacterized protein YprB with RNaseH-like and TPR domain
MTEAISPFLNAKVFDVEVTNLRTDLGVLMCAAFYSLADGAVESRSKNDFGKKGELALVKWVRQQIVDSDMLIGHNILAFDRHFVDGVLARYNLEPLPRRILVDTLMIARYGFQGLPSGNSLRNLSSFFKLGEVKESLDKEQWRQAMDDPQAMSELVAHCEADVRVTALLFDRLKPYWFRWQGR